MNQLFTKKDNLKESIPLISLLSALSIIMMIFMTYLPLSGIVLSFVLPLPSIICVLYIKTRYYYIYALTTFIISVLTCLGDFTFVIFNLIPVLISAFIMGFCIKNKFNKVLSVALTSFIMTFLNLMMLFIFNFFFNINFIEIFFNILQIKNTENFINFIPTLIYIYSLIESFIMLLVSLDQIKKFYNEEVSYKISTIIEISFIFLTTLISLILCFFNLEYFYLFLTISVTDSIIFFVNKKITLQNSIIFLIFLIFTWILYVLIYKNIVFEKSFVLFLIFPVLVLIYKSIDLTCKIRQK